jgi:immunity protein 74 of polymorphic toxin system
MLKRVSNQEVRGPGFSVRVPDIHYVHYIEGDRVAVIEFEGGTNEQGRIDFVVYLSSFRGWLQPHEYDDMTAIEREQVLSRISRSLDLLEMEHRFV